MARLCGGGEYLDGGEVRNAHHPDISIAPHLPGGPFDQVVAILAFEVSPCANETGKLPFRFASSSCIGHDKHITSRHEVFRITALYASVPQRAGPRLGRERQGHRFKLLPVASVCQ